MDTTVPKPVYNVLPSGILAGRVRRLKKLAEIVHSDDLVKKLQGVLDELEELSATDSTEVSPELLANLRNRFAKTPSPLDA